MCMSCAGWPWGNTVLAPPPTKDEYIYLDENHAFYPDVRQTCHFLPPQPSPNKSSSLSQHLPTPESSISGMPSYYTYGTHNPSTHNNPNVHYNENPANWPTVYQSTPAYAYLQGLHPPAPLWQSNQPAQAPVYYYGQPAAPGPAPGLYPNGVYCQSAAQAPAPGWPCGSSYTCYPSPQQQNSFSNFYNPYCAAPFVDFTNPAAAAAQVLAANAALAQAPNAPFMFVGKTQAEIDMQNAILATAYTNAGMIAAAPSMPTQIVPYKPAATQQFWCKEMDGSWTLREQREVMMGELNPGHWEKHATSGYFFWVRHSA